MQGIAYHEISKLTGGHDVAVTVRVSVLADLIDSAMWPAPKRLTLLDDVLAAIRRVQGQGEPHEAGQADGPAADPADQD